MIPTPLALTPGPAAALPVGLALGCALDLHLGPYESLPELAGWMGADWCRCRRCGSPITRATSRRSAA